MVIWGMGVKLPYTGIAIKATFWHIILVLDNHSGQFMTTKPPLVYPKWWWIVRESPLSQKISRTIPAKDLFHKLPRIIFVSVKKSSILREQAWGSISLGSLVDSCLETPPPKDLDLNESPNGLHHYQWFHAFGPWCWQVDPSTVAAVPEETVSPKSTVKPLSQKLGGMKFFSFEVRFVDPKWIFLEWWIWWDFGADVPVFHWWMGGVDYAVFFVGVGKNGRQPKKSMKSPRKKGVGSSKNSLEGFCGATQDYPDRICTSEPT